MTLLVSRKLALLMAPFFLLIDFWRRWGRWHEWPAILDDVIAGGLLVIALRILRRKPAEGRVYLAGAWGYCTGLMYVSFFAQLARLSEPDPSDLPPTLVVGVKAAMLLLSALGFVGALLGHAERPPEPAPDLTG